MLKLKVISFIVLFVLVLTGMCFKNSNEDYIALYKRELNTFKIQQQDLINTIKAETTINNAETVLIIKEQIHKARIKMKAIDFWLRYLHPLAYKKINAPLPVEWETEVFEKYEKPYKRIGAGLTLAELYMDEPEVKKDSLLTLLYESDKAIKTFEADSVTSTLQKPDHFFFANRLFLLNLSAIYTTGFECPNAGNIFTELNAMLASVKEIYYSFNSNYSNKQIKEDYLSLYAAMQKFVARQHNNPNLFDHFTFIKDYVNPLYRINQQYINEYRVYSKSYIDYSLNNDNTSIFNKDLYNGQNRKGVFIALDDQEKLNEIKDIGKMLFFDPILSGNGKRSCASCHKPETYFNDTTVQTNASFNLIGNLARNTPTLINAGYNHLLMLDGKHISLQAQAKDVITNATEMGCDADLIVSNVMSCEKYKKAFQRFKKFTPLYSEISIDHIFSAITMYYSSFSDFTSPFDRAINNIENISTESKQGFNLFMSKAQCGTCHFVPQFNGVKPPYIGSEFEVLGVPIDKQYKQISLDKGRYNINPATETLHAFRTGSLRNSTFTKPYMHNAVFNSIDDVIDFYDAGGGVGKGLVVDNQTLSTDSLRLTSIEKNALKAFIKTLDEDIILPKRPIELPATSLSAYKNRKVGGEY
jgi:cytochrome c peroxidase